MGSAIKKQKINKSGKSKAKQPVVEAEVVSEVEVSENEVEEEEEEEKEAEEEEEEEEVEVEEEEDVEEEEQLEDLDDLELDDEVDVADVSSDSGSESDSDFDSEIPKLKKKKNVDDGSASFATAFNAIIGSKLKAHTRKDPILARNKITLKKLESEKLESKAKRALLAEKKHLHDDHRIKQLLPSSHEPEKVRATIERERKLKKVAQKGVVRLFNAVLSTQVRTNEEISKEKVGQTKKEELMNEISKEKFLDLVQAAGNS